jgi:DNA polymerase-4
MAATILHLDMDSFFVSVELLHDPSLRGKPVVVGHDGPRGVVASASYEARKFGVHSAMPSSRARALCPRLVFLPGRHGEYSAWSRRVREVLDGISPLVEAASIDEFYVDLTGCERLHGNFLGLADRVFRSIRDGLGLPCSMGLAPNRTLAKIGSKVAKPRGIVSVLPGGEEAFMGPLPVGLIPGVGPVLREALSRMGVVTAGELAAIPLPVMRRAFGSWGLELHLKARGQWRGGVHAEERDPKSIGHETTFPVDSEDPGFLDAVLFHLVEKSAFRLRAHGFEAGRVTVKVRYADFTTVTRVAGLEPTCVEQDICREALPLLREMAGRRMRVRLVGVSLSALRPMGHQIDLFAAADPRRRDVCRCLDRVKNRFGSHSMTWAAGVTAP